MRLYPPARAFGRETVGDCEIGDYHVPAGTPLIMSQWVTHRDPRYFPPYAYFPFGGGPRLCIGRSFARTEAMLLLTTIDRKFRLRLGQDRPVEPQPSLTLRPKTGMRVVLARH
jgi:cytochrome P450